MRRCATVWCARRRDAVRADPRRGPAIRPAGGVRAGARRTGRRTDAVIPVLPVTDTIKVVRDGVVHSTPVRDELVAVQTPQGFRLDILKDAHATLDVRVTDDAMLVERAGIEVHVVDGSQRSFKITTGFDMRVAESVLAQQDPGSSAVRWPSTRQFRRTHACDGGYRHRCARVRPRFPAGSRAVLAR